MANTADLCGKKLKIKMCCPLPTVSHLFSRLLPVLAHLFVKRTLLLSTWACREGPIPDLHNPRLPAHCHTRTHKYTPVKSAVAILSKNQCANQESLSTRIARRRNAMLLVSATGTPRSPTIAFFLHFPPLPAIPALTVPPLVYPPHLLACYARPSRNSSPSLKRRQPPHNYNYRPMGRLQIFEK